MKFHSYQIIFFDDFSNLHHSATGLELSHDCTDSLATLNFQIAQVLIDHGAEVNTFDKTSKATPLHRAASRY